MGEGELGLSKIFQNHSKHHHKKVHETVDLVPFVQERVLNGRQIKLYF